MSDFLRRVSSAVFRRPSRILEEINSNALMLEWSRKNRPHRQFDYGYYPTLPDRIAGDLDLLPAWVGHPRLTLMMYEYLNAEVIGGGPIDYLEFGVFKGATIRRWAEINRDPGSRFYGFDTFEGMPERWDCVRNGLEKGHFDAGGRLPETGDGRIRYVKGLFQETLRPFLKDFEPAHRIVVHNDSTLYSSTLYCLTQLDALLVGGSLLIFDEFYSSSHEFQAFYDYTTSYLRRYRVLAAVGRDPYLKVAIYLE
jgi:hypothetical protein